jgi:Threonine dehydrogenase and related Zn-dependent dehydrogenases
MYSAGDVRIENVPDPQIIEPTDAVIRVTRACVCGSDLWPYQKMEQQRHRSRDGARSDRCGRRRRAEFERLSAVISLSCRSRSPTAHACFATTGFKRRVSMADFSVPQRSPEHRPKRYEFLWRWNSLSVGAHADDALMPSLLTLSDVMGTGHHAAIIARVSTRKECGRCRRWSCGIVRCHCREATWC